MTENFKRRNLKKFYIEQTIIESASYPYQNPLKILVASDIHYHENVDKEVYILLLKACQNLKPDYVVMVGDQIETPSFLNSSAERDFFSTLVTKIAKVCPLLIIPGNHEIGNFEASNFMKRLKQNSGEKTLALKYFETLNEIENVYFLNNTQVELNGLTFLGFNPRIETYLQTKKPLSKEMFVEDYLNSSLKMIKDSFNIILTHSPAMLMDSKVLEMIPEFKVCSDLVITGHFHDGYMPKILDRFTKNNNIGIFFTPLIAPYPGIVCRGVHQFGRGHLFVSQGFRKYTADLHIMNALEKITANDIELLLITKKKTKKLVKN